jgi:hypothetical protein
VFEQRRYQRRAAPDNKVPAVLRLDAANALYDVRSEALDRTPPEAGILQVIEIFVLGDLCSVFPASAYLAKLMAFTRGSSKSCAAFKSKYAPLVDR